jgi:hypothetical protein
MPAHAYQGKGFEALKLGLAVLPSPVAAEMKMPRCPAPDPPPAVRESPNAVDSLDETEAEVGSMAAVTCG